MLVKQGDDPTCGVRPLWRVLSGELAEGDTVQVDYGAGAFTFTKVEAVTAAAYAPRER